MTRHNVWLNGFKLGIVLLAFALTLSAAFAAGAPAESLDSLHEKAKKERLRSTPPYRPALM